MKFELALKNIRNKKSLTRDSYHPDEFIKLDSDGTIKRVRKNNKISKARLSSSDMLASDWKVWKLNGESNKKLSKKSGTKESIKKTKTNRKKKVS